MMRYCEFRSSLRVDPWERFCYLWRAIAIQMLDEDW